MLGLIIRFVVSALVILFLGFLLPGFHVVGFWNAMFAAVAIAAIGWLAEALFGHRVSPYGRGLIGFLAGAAVIYGVQFLVVSMHVTVVGALLASLVIGVIDAFVPSELR
jgi:putative membrane protein